MMDFDGDEVKKDFEEAFERPLETLTERQMWWIVKIAKHVRGRARNNAALNNYLVRNFKHMMFTTLRVKSDLSGEYYDKLHIEKRAQ